MSDPVEREDVIRCIRRHLATSPTREGDPFWPAVTDDIRALPRATSAADLAVLEASAHYDTNEKRKRAEAERDAAIEANGQLCREFAALKASLASGHSPTIEVSLDELRKRFPESAEAENVRLRARVEELKGQRDALILGNAEAAREDAETIAALRERTSASEALAEALQVFSCCQRRIVKQDDRFEPEYMVDCGKCGGCFARDALAAYRAGRG